MEELFKTITLWLAVGTEAAAALVIGLATTEATLHALWLFVPGVLRRSENDSSGDRKEEVRLRLGRWLAVALEFELAAGILKTAVRTLMKYFVTWEERRLRKV